MSSPGSDAARVRLLVAGAGLFGREHLARLIGRSDVEVVGVADASADALAEVRRRFGAGDCSVDPLRLIDRTPADAIVVATPADSHVEICARALAAGLCVLLEKPVAPSAAAASRLLAAACASRGFVLPGHVLRFSRDHRGLVDVVRAGGIGEVVYVNSRRYRDDSHAIRYPDADPVLMTLIHDIDLAQWITGTSFCSVVARRTGGPGFRSITAISASAATGAICDLRTAWTFPGADAPADRLEVLGTRGSVEFTAGEGLRVYSEGRRTDRPADGADDPLRNEQDHFLDLVADRSRAPALGLSEAIEGLKLADAAIRSLRLGCEIPV
jgi:predicted dehydrogenase